MGTIANDTFPLLIDERNVQRFLDAHIDPDAERMRYFGRAMMDSVCNPDKPAPQTVTLMQVMDLHKPRTLDELRVCVDAARLLTP